MPKYILLIAIAFSLQMGCSKRSATSSTTFAEAPQPMRPPEPKKPAVAKPMIVSRKEWKASEPRGEKPEHTIHCITIHHTGVNQKPSATLEKKLLNLQTYSHSEAKLPNGKTKPVWFDVPYHFYIAEDGRIGEGRPIQFVSDTNTEYDPTNHATIVLEGNFEVEQPTDAQQESVAALAAWLSVEYHVPASKIKAHNDYAKTACPGANWKKTLPALRDKVAELTGATE